MSTSDPLLQLMRDDDAELLRERVAKLPEMERLVLRLRHYEGLDLKDIGACLSFTPERVAKLARSAVLRVRLMAAEPR